MGKKKTGIMKDCGECGKSFYVQKYKIENKKFCSYQCKRKNAKGVMKECSNCNKWIYVYKHLSSRKKFCSKKCLYESRNGSIPWNKGVKHSQDHIRNLKEAKKREGNIRLYRRKGENLICSYCKSLFYVSRNQVERKRKFCSLKCFGASSIGREFSLEHRNKISESNKGKKRTQKQKEIYKVSAKIRYHNPEYLSNLRKSMNLKPNNKEKILINLFSEHKLPYKFVGDWQFWVGDKNPDFISTDGQKKIIELFGDYWHKQKKNIPYSQTEEGTRQIYSNLGFEVLIIWESEMKDLEEVLKKIKSFHSQGMPISQFIEQSFTIV